MFPSCAFADNEILFTVNVNRFSYPTEYMRIEKGIVCSEKALFQIIEPHLTLIDFKLNSDFSEHMKKSLNPMIGTEIYSLTLNNANELIEILKRISDCPSYPFFGGLSFNLLDKIIDYTIQSENVELMRELLMKNTTNCANELVSGLYYKLKTNKILYLKAFSKLTDYQQRVAVVTGHDFNQQDSLTLFNDKFVSNIDIDLKMAARKYNDLVKEWNNKGIQFVKDLKKIESR